FHRLSLASLLLNIVVGALMALLALSAIAALLLSQLSETLAAPLVRLTESLNWLMVHSVDPFARAHLASVRLPEYSGRMACIYALYYVPCLLLAFMLARWQPLRPESNGEGKRSISTRPVAQLSGLASATLLVLI
ncbi:MAG: hypothetical protein M3362_17295, partial [Acidobacteriota bacterium]|nr:hypothetical protein [Acidobacteriota bacterium]